MTYTWVEPFAGAAAVALRLVGGRHLLPPVAWMGGKRRYARAIADAMGVPAGRPSRVVLCDAGPWGWVWPLLFDPASCSRVAAVLRSWQGEHPRALWERLAASPPSGELDERDAAQWLWLQARSASGVPIWWDGWRHVDGRGRAATDRGEDLRWPGHQAVASEWRSAEGSPRSAYERWGEANEARGSWEQGSAEGRRPQPAGQRGEWRMGEELKKAKRGTRSIAQGKTGASEWRMCNSGGRSSTQGLGRTGKLGGMVNPATIADRAEAIAEAFRPVEVRVRHGQASGLEPGPGFALLDPPYEGATGYGWGCPRAEVLALAESHAAAGAVVAVCEAVPLELPGWSHLDLTRPEGKPEWLTLSRPPARVPAKQRRLFS